MRPDNTFRTCSECGKHFIPARLTIYKLIVKLSPDTRKMRVTHQCSHTCWQAAKARNPRHKGMRPKINKGT